MIKHSPTYRYERMLFDEGSTSREDYRFGNIVTYPPTVYKPKQTELKVQPPRLKDIQALSEWNTKCPYVPFYLYYKPKEILQTDPRDTQKSFEKPVNLDREEIQKTRPRVCMFPAVALDDIKEPTRQYVVDNIYTTTAKAAMEEGAALTAAETLQVKAPLPGVYAPSNAIKLPPLRPPYVSPEWRMDSVTWDARQVRSHVEPTDKFWLAEGSNCQVCKNEAALKIHEDVMKRC